MDNSGGGRQSAVTLRESFARMARQFEGDLMRVALRLCRGNHDWASDLVQESLVRAYKAYLDGNYREQRDSPKPWLARILTNHFINEYRRKQKWDAGVSLDDLDFSADARASEQSQARSDELPGVRLMSALFDEEIEKALAMLSDPLRMTILLVDVEGMSYEEAAMTLGIPVGTVRSRLARARMQLEDLLADYAKKRRLIA